MRRGVVFLILALAASLCNAQWVQTNGPYGSNVACFAVSGTNLFAGTWSGGVFLTANHGTSWTAINSGLTNLDVRALTVNDNIEEIAEDLAGSIITNIDKR